MSEIHFNFSQRNQEEKRTVKLSCDYVKQSQIHSLVKKKKKTSLLVSRLSVCLTFCCIHRLISTTSENACKRTLLKVKFVISQINDQVSSLKYYPHHQTWCRSCLVMCSFRRGVCILSRPDACFFSYLCRNLGKSGLRVSCLGLGE